MELWTGGLLGIALVVVAVLPLVGPIAARSDAPVDAAELAAAELAAEPAAPIAEDPIEPEIAASGPPEGSPAGVATVVTVALGPGEEDAREAIERWMAALWPGYTVEFVDWTAEWVDVYIGHLPPNGDLEPILLEARPWVPLTRFTSDVDDLALANLQRAFEGRIGSWAELDGPDAPIVPILVAADPTIGDALGVSADADVIDILSEQTFATRAGELAARPGLLVLAPIRLADPRFRALTVDGVSPLLRLGADGDYPLVANRWLGVRGDGWPGEDRAGRDGTLFREGLIRFIADELTSDAPRVETVTAAGDVILGRKVDEKLVAYGDYTRPFHAVADELAAADLTLVNLECTLTDAVTPPHHWGTFSFGSSTRAVDGLRYAGIDVVSLANNHSRDMGLRPFVEMLEALEAAEIGHVGGGRDRAEAHAPHIVEIRGTRFAILGYDEIGSAQYGATHDTPGTAAMMEEAVRRDVADARARADVVIPFFHWGVEYTNRPTERQRRIAHAAVEAGAALVLGSHAHWVQAVEFYDGAFIAYGLGNFVFDQDWSVETTQGVILQTSFVDGRLASVRFQPVQIRDLHQPHFVDRPTGRRILDRMFGVSDL